MSANNSIERKARRIRICYVLKKYIFRFATAVLVLYMALSFVAGIFVAEGALHPARRSLTSIDENQETLRVASAQASVRDVSIIASDGIALQAWELDPEKPDGNAVILLHGLSDNRLGMAGYADLFLQHGYQVLIPDARAHGISGGQLATYGLLESDDIRRWFEWLKAHDHPRCIYGFGESMGAAQLLEALQVEPQFCAVAGECPFSNFREIAYDRMGQHFNAGDWVGRTVLRPLVESAFLYARWKYGVNLRQVSPEDSVAATKVPVFLIHGERDSNIPPRHSRRIAVRNHDVVFWEVPGAEHTGAVNAAREEFDRRLIAWFEGHALVSPAK